MGQKERESLLSRNDHDDLGTRPRGLGLPTVPMDARQRSRGQTPG